MRKLKCRPAHISTGVRVIFLPL